MPNIINLDDERERLEAEMQSIEAGGDYHADDAKWARLDAIDVRLAEIADLVAGLTYRPGLDAMYALRRGA